MSPARIGVSAKAPSDVAEAVPPPPAAVTTLISLPVIPSTASLPIPLHVSHMQLS